MPDAQKHVELGELVDALLTELRYSTGDLPPLRTVSAEEALTVLEDIYAGTDASDQHLPALAKQMGKEIACHNGCPGKCCESLVLISEPEGLRIADELRKPERREIRERFLARVIDWAEKSRRQGSTGCRFSIGWRRPRLCEAHGRAWPLALDVPVQHG